MESFAGLNPASTANPLLIKEVVTSSSVLAVVLASTSISFRFKRFSVTSLSVGSIQLQGIFYGLQSEEESALFPHL